MANDFFSDTFSDMHIIILHYGTKPNSAELEYT